MSREGSEPVVVEHGTHLEVAWRNGRGEWFLCSPEVIEGDVAMINELRATVRENGQAIAAALNIHRPCHRSLVDVCERSHSYIIEAPECIGCGYGSSDQTTEWPCATAQALGATR